MDFKEQLQLKKKADSGDIEAIFEYGMFLYLETSDYETALNYLLAAASRDYEPSFGDIGIILYRMKNDIPGAESWFQKAEKANCLFAPSAYEYGMLNYLGKRNYKDALKYFLKAADEKYEPAYGEIAAILYKEKNDIESAERWFEKAEKANCLLAPAAYEYGMLNYLEKRNYKDALKYFFQAANEKYEPAYGEIATIFYREKNDIESAEMWFEKAERANCLYAPAAYEYGMLKYLERRDYKAALRYLLKSANDDFEMAYGDVGIIYYSEKHDINSALNWFQKAEKANCLFAPAAYEYGMLYLEIGNTDQALKYLISAANDHYDIACEELIEFYHQRGDIENEEMWAKKYEDAVNQ